MTGSISKEGFVPLEYASLEVCDMYVKKAQEWYDSSRLTFSSFRRTHIEAIAEYLANQDGYTLIPDFNKDEDNDPKST